MADQIELEQIV